MTAPNCSIETRKLCKSFPRNPARWPPGGPFRAGKQIKAAPALVEVDLRVEKGELLVLLGPNGAGKTTLIKILSTLILPDSGQAWVNGYPLKKELEIRRSIGLVSGDERSFFWRLSARSNLEFFAALSDLSPSRSRQRIEALGIILGLEEYLPRRFDHLPGGIKQRLSLARALLHNPSILLLDEPTKSLDPLAAPNFRNIVSRLAREQGHTIIWVTHRLEEAEELECQIAIMNKGRLKRVGEIEKLREIPRSGKEPPSGEATFERYLKALEQSGPAPAKKTPEKEQETVLPSRKSKKTFGWRKAPAFIKKDFLFTTSYRFAFLLQILGIFLPISIFFFIARLFGSAATPLLKNYGGDYFSFVLIGIAFSSYLYVALSSFSHTIRQDQVTGTLEAVLATPTGLGTILICSGLWSFLFTSFRVIFYLLIGGLVFGVNFSRLNLPAALLIQILTIFSFAALGIISAGFVMVFKKGDPLALALGSASSLLGGVYFPIAVLPGWLQKLSLFLPITYSLRAMRLALLEGYNILALRREITVLLIFALILSPLSFWTFRWAVRKAKERGSLVQY